MCRACSAGGRRCPGDTPEARRARRYASASKADPRLKDSVRGTPPAVADGEAATATPEHDLSTPEGIRDRGAELRTMREASSALTSECMDHMREHGSLDKETAQEIVRKHGISDDLVKYVEGTNGQVFPMLSMEKYEKESTALGQKADQWLDGELSEQTIAYEEALSEWNSADMAYRDIRAGDAVREEGGLGRLRDADAERARTYAAVQDKKDAYYARKRELMGQLRESGQELDWTTAGTSTPARVNETIQASAQFLPKDWIASSNHLSSDAEVAKNPDKVFPVLPVRVRESTSRNHYSPRNYVTKRETKPDRSFYEGRLAEKVDVYSSPQYGVVPEEEWTENDRRFASPGDVLVQKYHVARGPSYFSNDPGANVLDSEGNFALKGRAASGWKQYTYTDSNGEEQTCWRKPATTTTTNREYGIAELTIPKGQGRKGGPNTTATHELIHRCENTNPSIPAMESAFLVRRTTNADGEREPLQRYYPDTPGEKVRPDDFIDRYVGKDYGRSSSFYEVMSVGSEAAFHGSHGGFGKTPDPRLRQPARRDDDHHSFVLGTYLTA